MTLVILLLLDFGAVLIMSAVEDVPLLQTIGDIWNGTASANHPAFTTGGTGPTFKSQGVPATGTTGIPAQATGSARGPAQADAYHMAVVRAYLQSQR